MYINRPPNVLSLREALPMAERGGYAIGAFSPRYVAMIRPALRAAERCRSPLIVQISAGELRRYGVTPIAFATELYTQLDALAISVPVVLHLNHTRDQATIQAAVGAGFTSVMLDASELPFAENVAQTRAVVVYAACHDVSVEGELGRIGTTDCAETDDEPYTDPDEAAAFVARTGVDALAISVGTAYGSYTARRPCIDLERLAAIRARAGCHLVLHGCSGVPAALVRAAIGLPGGGVSKVNIATDLELAALGALEREACLTNAEMSALPPARLKAARAAFEAAVADKIRNFLGSAGRADDPAWRDLLFEAR